MGITYPKTQESAIVAKFPHYLRFPGIHSAHHSFSFGFMAALQHVYSTLFPLVGKFPHYWYFPQITPLQFNVFAIVAKFRHYFAIVAKFRHYLWLGSLACHTFGQIHTTSCAENSNSGEISPLLHFPANYTLHICYSWLVGKFPHYFSSTVIPMHPFDAIMVEALLESMVEQWG